MLDREESLAIQSIAGSVQRLGDGVLAATDLRGRIRRHPFLAIGIGALSGFLGGPLLFGALKRVVTNSSGAPNHASGSLHGLPGLVIASLRGVRARG